MEYKKIHDNIIFKAKFENRKRNRDRSKQKIYYELHHIIPKCLGGGEEKENKVLLTAREHFLIHWLLCRIYPDNYKLSCAFFRSCQINHVDRQFTPSSRAYQEARENYSKLTSLKHKGRKLTLEHKKASATKNSKGEIEVYQHGEFIGKYISRSAAEKSLKIGHIDFYFEGKNRKQKDGYTFIFIPKDDKVIKNKVTVKQSRKPMIETQKQYLSSLFTGVYKPGRPILQCDLNGELIKQYESMNEVIRKNNFSMSGLARAIKTERKFKGYIWK